MTTLIKKIYTIGQDDLIKYMNLPETEKVNKIEIEGQTIVITVNMYSVGRLKIEN